MKIRPTLNEVREILKEGNYGVIPVSTEIFSDSTTPIEVLIPEGKAIMDNFLTEKNSQKQEF